MIAFRWAPWRSCTCCVARVSDAVAYRTCSEAHEKRVEMGLVCVCQQTSRLHVIAARGLPRSRKRRAVRERATGMGRQAKSHA
jgi:hypothetical protein